MTADLTSPRECRVSLHVRALPGPSHNDVLNTVVTPDAWCRLHVALHIPPESNALRLRLSCAEPAIFELRRPAVIAPGEPAPQFEPRLMDAAHVAASAFPIAKCGDEWLRLFVPQPPLSIVFDLGGLTDAQHWTALALNVRIAPRQRDDAFAEPAPAHVLAQFGEPWKESAAGVRYASAFVQTCAQTAARRERELTVVRAGAVDIAQRLSHVVSRAKA